MGVSLVAEFVTEVLAECRTVPYAAPQVGIVWAGPGEPLGSIWGASGEPRELLEHLGGLVVSRTDGARVERQEAPVEFNSQSAF